MTTLTTQRRVLEEEHRRHCPHCRDRERGRIPRPRFRPDIEGVRAIAVVLVALNHAGVPGFGGGFVGVDVFFVLSGFLITGLLVDESERSGRVSIARFYGRRIRRILPLSVLVTLVTVVATYVVAGAGIGNRVAADGAWASVFLANIHFAAAGVDYFNRGGFVSPLEHYWSLGVEEQFYLVWPLLVLLVALVAPRSARTRRALVAVLLALIGAGSLWWSVQQTAAAPTAAYFSPFTRAWELGVGALLAVLLTHRSPVHRLGGSVLTGLGVAVLVGSLLFIDDGTPFPSAWAAVPVLATGAIVVGGLLAPGSPASRVLGSPPMRFVGERSYGFYLWHQPFIVLPVLALGEQPLVVRLLLLVVAFAVSSATYALLENPVRRSRALARRLPLTLGVGAGLVAAGLSVTLVAQVVNRVEVQETTLASAPVEQLLDLAGVEQAIAGAVGTDRLPEDLQPPADAIAEQGSLAPEEAACDRDYDVTQADLCFLGDTTSDRTIVLWGDSHASMWAPGLSAVASQAGVRLAVFAKYGCAPLLGVTPWHPAEDRAYPECAQFKDSVVPLLQELQPEEVVMTGAFKSWAYTEDGSTKIEGGTYDSDGHWQPSDTVDEVWMAGLTRSIKAAEATGAEVTVIGDIAYPQQDPTTCFVAHRSSLHDCETPRDTAVWAEHDQTEQQTTEGLGATYVPTVSWFCTDRTCPPVVDSISIYRDDYHVTRQFSLWMARVLGQATGILDPTSDAASG